MCDWNIFESILSIFTLSVSCSLCNVKHHHLGYETITYKRHLKNAFSCKKLHIMNECISIFAIVHKHTQRHLKTSSRRQDDKRAVEEANTFFQEFTYYSARLASHQFLFFFFSFQLATRCSRSTVPTNCYVIHRITSNSGWAFCS